MKINIINCFCTSEAFSGNPAAIVSNFTGTNDEKQKLATKLNLPVTVFLSQIIDKTCNLEFFYPKTEMPLCLHGSIGAAYLIAKEKNLNDINFIAKDNTILKAKIYENLIQILVSPKVVPSVVIDKLEICKLLNLNHVNEIDLTLPLLISSVGSPKLLVPLKSFDMLSTLNPNFELIAKWSENNSVNGLYVYTEAFSKEDLNFYAKGFNPKGGNNEDAATSVAAAALSLALKQSIVVGQGIFLNRPSKIIVSYENPHTIWVGGIAKEQTDSEKIYFNKMVKRDFQLLYQWFKISHVLEWYEKGKEYTLEMIEKKYLSRIDDNTIQSFIIYDDNKPVGYIQFYHLTHHLPEGVNDNHPLFNNFKPSQLAGIDLFIADKNYLCTNFSSIALKRFINKYLKNNFQAILVDPLKNNLAAIKFFEKNGFEYILSQDSTHVVMMKNLTNEVTIGK